MTDQAKAAECVEAFKPLAEAAQKVLDALKPRPMAVADGAFIVIDDNEDGIRTVDAIDAKAGCLLINEAVRVRFAANADLLEACKPVISEAMKWAGDYLHSTRFLDAPVELTLTIRELRAIHAATEKATGGAK